MKHHDRTVFVYAIKLLMTETKKYNRRIGLIKYNDSQMHKDVTMLMWNIEIIIFIIQDLYSAVFM